MNLAYAAKGQLISPLHAILPLQAVYGLGVRSVCYDIRPDISTLSSKYPINSLSSCLTESRVNTRPFLTETTYRAEEAI